jgi:DNA replication and repair protein RecF
MYLQELHLRYFRNYTRQRVNFKNQKTILLGNNAQGKSNLLEAVELLSTLTSYRGAKDRDLVQESQTTAELNGQIKRRFGDYELGLSLHQQGRRILTINGEKLRRHLDFLGTLNTVLFSSLDLDLVRGGPDYRRLWIDNLLLQLEPVYDYIIRQYYRVLRQRNALLKKLRTQNNHQFSDSNLGDNLDVNLQLQLWDQKLAETGSRVTRRRARVLARLAPLAQAWHARISNQTEILKISYVPNINWLQDEPAEVQQAIKEQIQQHRRAELNLGSTVVGPHRDEIEFTLNDTPARSYGSQGQQRTLVLALKLAELQLIEQVIGEPPLLLLDDVLAELDSQRQNHLMAALGDRFQTIITTTHLNSFERNLLQEAQILRVENGHLNPL